jgi:hypothetical protein
MAIRHSYFTRRELRKRAFEFSRIPKTLPGFLWNFTLERGSDLKNDLPGSIFALC